MGNHYLDWAVLGVILLVLWLLAVNFNRRVYRIAAVGVGTALVLFVTWRGLQLKSRPDNYFRAFVRGGDKLAQFMLNPLLHARQSVALGRVGWIALLVVLVTVLVILDTWSARREQPRVSIPEAPDLPAGPQDPGDQRSVSDRRELTEKLRFVLPAVDVRRPASMPGATTVDSLASLAAASGVQGSGLARAMLQAAQAVQPRPRTYEVRVFTESCQENGNLNPNGPKLRVTVEVRDARTGQSTAVQGLRVCSARDAAERVAGYTARQVFRQDPATPAWAVGSVDGEDLSAYLLTRMIRPARGTYNAWRACRRGRRRVLEQVVPDDAGCGVVGYELAGLFDLDCDNLRALLLHLGNREQYPQFLRGRYRLALSLSMLAGPVFGFQWPAPGGAPGSGAPWNGQAKLVVRPRISAEEASELRERLVRQLGFAGLFRHLSDAQVNALRSGEDPRQVKMALLRLARREIQACWRRRHASVLLWTAFCSRRVRSVSLLALTDTPYWWRRLRRRLWSLEFVRDIIDLRLSIQETGLDATRYDLGRAQRRARRRLHRPVLPGERPPLLPRRRQGRANDERVSWQAYYNAACLHALAPPECHPDGGVAREAVQLLRLAISHPQCELDAPAEWVANDPGLLSLRGSREFDEFVRERARYDFEPDRRNEAADPWFQALLPTRKSSAPARDPSVPG